jgi:hypothetical protein
MSATKLITLGIAELERGSDDFNIITMDMHSQNIGPINVARDEIISRSGKVFWDIGFLTTLTEGWEGQIDRNANIQYTVRGETAIGENQLGQLKKILEAKSKKPAAFFNNEKLQSGVVKVSRVEEIYTRSNESERRHYMRVHIKGMPADEKPKLILNKDYRWVKFWSWIFDNGEYDDKRQKYIQLFKDSNRSLYLVLYRRYFAKGPYYWIAGMHWL